MLDFELPLVRGNITIADAIKETIESNRSGVVFEVHPGELRLIHADSLLLSATNEQDSLESLKSVVFEPVMEAETVPDSQLFTFVSSANRKFGFKGMLEGNIARVFSISETYGQPFAAASPGRRCTRPGKPANKSPQDWYHYPPINHNPADLNHCLICKPPYSNHAFNLS